MTTIVTDGKSMAADGLMTTNEGIICHRAYRKIRTCADGSIVGVAGGPETAEQFWAWVNGEGKCSRRDFLALRLYADGRLSLYDGSLMEVEVQAPFAIGSGAQFAVAALDAGVHLLKAIEIAAARDMKTGGEMLWVRPLGSLDDADGAPCICSVVGEEVGPRGKVVAG